MTNEDAAQFRAYLNNCTVEQLFWVLEREDKANRVDYVRLCLEAIKERCRVTDF